LLNPSSEEEPEPPTVRNGIPDEVDDESLIDEPPPASGPWTGTMSLPRERGRGRGVLLTLGLVIMAVGGFVIGRMGGITRDDLDRAQAMVTGHTLVKKSTVLTLPEPVETAKPLTTTNSAPLAPSASAGPVGTTVPSAAPSATGFASTAGSAVGSASTAAAFASSTAPSASASYPSTSAPAPVSATDLLAVPLSSLPPAPPESGESRHRRGHQPVAAAPDHHHDVVSPPPPHVQRTAPAYHPPAHELGVIPNQRD
jgi:hypothetical protein